LKKQKILLDTNILLTNPEIVNKNPENYAICLTTLRELDKLKRIPELNFAVRNAIKSIYFNLKKITIDINEKIDYENLTNDEKIILSAQKNDWSFRTEDIGAMVIADSMFNVVLDSTFDKEELKSKNYKGYRIKIIKDIDIWIKLYHTSIADIELVQKYGKTLNKNEYLILFNETKEEYILIFKNSKKEINQVPLKKYKSILREIGIKIKPLDVYQWIALDLVLNDNPISIIEGKLGTGKTLITIMGALMTLKSKNQSINKYNKILISRPPIEIDKRYKSGYLPGELDNKIEPWLIPFKSNLEFIYNSHNENNEKNNEKSNEIFEKDFEFLSLEHIQGASIHDSILILDEYQLLDQNMLKQVLSRIAVGSKVILIGDPLGQSYNINRGNEGFKIIHKHLKNQDLLSYIKLDNIYRSELAEFIEKIFSI
jgi:PhoH-like ATPase